MAIPRYIPGRGGERPHWALPNGMWVAAPQSGFYQPPRRPPTQAGFSQVRPNPNAGFTQVRPPNAAAQFTQLNRQPVRGPGRPASDPIRHPLVQALMQAAMASPDAISPAGTPGRGTPAPGSGVGDIDAYLQWLLLQSPRGAGGLGAKVY